MSDNKLCECCNKEIHFGTNWFWSDAGYGDTDYGGVEDNLLLNAMICPVCGRLKEKAIEHFGSKESAVKWLIKQNLDNLNLDEVKCLLDIDDLKEYNIVLKQSGITEEKRGKFYCSCGELLIDTNCEYETIKSVEEQLTKNKVNFCKSCGKKILPLS